jgi:hypothetical protein
LRNHIERAIGVLKKRFPILKVGTLHPIENQVKIPIAVVVFHNLIRMHNGDEGWLRNQPDNILPSSFIDVPKGDNVSSFSSQIENGNAQRDAIALSMWADYTHNQS